MREDLRYNRFNIGGASAKPYIKIDGSVDTSISATVNDDVSFQPYSGSNPNGQKIIFGNGGDLVGFLPYIKNVTSDDEANTINHELGSFGFKVGLRYTEAGVDKGGLLVGLEEAILSSDSVTAFAYTNGYTEHQASYSYFGFGNNDYIEAIAGQINVYGGEFGLKSTKHGFFSATPITKPAITGAKGGNVALTNLLIGLANLGLVTDSTT